ncbi:zinc finger-containing protein [Westerdykella ornata]|uniref:Zinc finger-containing protein n=1 Tax=Westerdykella ornata TaxID=318751 RepID=A0A6A6JSC4_WESOR|nr:zinc finger-containing protein [Westerdykella ornata]KAF2279155.1 zinc finger-containing protein [Westerdykella ornata]
MVDYHPYSGNMPHDFDLYAPQEQYEFVPTSQAFLPSNYSMDPSFSTPYEPVDMAPMPEPLTSQELQQHYDAIAQGVKPAYQYTPQASPSTPSQTFEQPPVLSTSSESGASVSSSNMPSPSLNPQYTEPWNPMANGLGLPILQSTPGFEYEGLVAEKVTGYPNLVQPFMQFPQSPYPEFRTTPSPYFPIEHPPSPALSHVSSQSQRPGSRQFKRGSQSPYLHTQQFQPYPLGQRRRSDASLHSQQSGASRKSGSHGIDDETREKGLCPLPECGRVFKDLRAHMLTHQNERPEKCPIATCEYHVKGFARKYDKNRHTLTHYKGTMVCGFCPGSGSAAEKSFNRADVFKRHLTSVHGVEQNPPNSRKKSPSGKKAHAGQQNMTGTCSTCSVTFANAQEFYEHLDDCVLRVVQQADPSEAINQRLLTSTSGGRGLRAGLTFSKGGVAITGSGRKRRKNYPVSWGCPTDRMKMKKRVLCVFDGPRRLWKDDMMLDQEFEVRMKLPDGKSYVTDLDVQTLKRAEAIHGATPEERGPYVPDYGVDAVGENEADDFVSGSV